MVVRPVEPVQLGKGLTRLYSNSMPMFGKGHAIWISRSRVMRSAANIGHTPRFVEGLLAAEWDVFSGDPPIRSGHDVSEGLASAESDTHRLQRSYFRCLLQARSGYAVSESTAC